MMHRSDGEPPHDLTPKRRRRPAWRYRVEVPSGTGMRRRPHECLVLLIARNHASPTFSMVRLTFDPHHAASPCADRGQKHDPMTVPKHERT